MTRDPLPPPVVPASAYDDEYYLGCCAGFLEWRTSQGSEMAALYPGVLERAGLRAGETLVDIGAGRGELIVAAAQRGATAVGVEYSEAAVELARRTLRAHGDPPRARIVLAGRALAASAGRVRRPRHDDRRDRAPQPPGAGRGAAGSGPGAASGRPDPHPHAAQPADLRRHLSPAAGGDSPAPAHVAARPAQPSRASDACRRADRPLAPAPATEDRLRPRAGSPRGVDAHGVRARPSHSHHLLPPRGPSSHRPPSDVRICGRR